MGMRGTPAAWWFAMNKLAKRLTVALTFAFALGATFAMAVAWWLQLPLSKVAISVAVAILIASGILLVSLASLTEPLQKLAAPLKTGEKPSDLLLQELGELGDAIATAWQRWHGALNELREERTLLSAILGRMAEAVIAADESGKVLLVNFAAEGMFRLPPDWSGRRLAELVLPFELMELMQKALRQGAPQWGEVHIVHPEERFLDAYATPLIADGKRIGVLLVARDLTELKRLERIRRDFVANVSHELRTPIATLRSLTEALLMGGKDDPEVRDKFLQAIADEAERMGKLLDNLLELARLEAGRREWRWQNVSVSDCVAQVAERFKPFAERKGLKLTVRTEPDLTVRTDPEALAQILSNLLDNAVKYTERGEIAVVAERLETADGVWVAVHVRDTGIGIPPEHLPRIFERFYRVDKARSRQQGGFGLGLSIAKHLAESLGGKITVQSEVGKGSIFTLWLPIGSQEGNG
jgi:two-component system phosphate regulon sensor histidine kinase PhoR